MLKKSILLFLILSNIFFMTGCWNYVELEKQLNVSGIAIDVGKNGKKYHLTAEVITPGEGQDSQVTRSLIDSDGNTVFEAIRNLINISSQKMYFGHCKVMIISQELCENGISEILDLVIRNHEVRLNMNVAISKGCDAKEILSCECKINPVISYKCVELLESAQQYLGDGDVNETYKIFNLLQNKGTSLTIPSFELVEIDENKSFKLEGVGVFDNDKLIGYLDTSDLRMLSFVKNKIDTGLLTAEIQPDVFISYEISKNDTQTEFNEKDDKLHVNIKTKTIVNIGEAENEAHYIEEENILKSKKILEDKIKEDINNLVKTAQTNLCCDIFGFGNQIMKQHPKIWDKYKNNWNEVFKTLDVNITSEIKITGTGITDKASSQS